jgi:hypothetical protein
MTEVAYTPATLADVKRGDVVWVCHLRSPYGHHQPKSFLVRQVTSKSITLNDERKYLIVDGHHCDGLRYGFICVGTEARKVIAEYKFESMMKRHKDRLEQAAIKGTLPERIAALRAACDAAEKWLLENERPSDE